MASKRSRATFEADLQAQQSPYVIYGTPLPPLDPDTRDDGSYVPVWKQEVTDEQGRKRLHGAFTGGFSAGYFNTVGSKEGWTPSTFVSSRATRKKDAPQTQQRPEDFMDEEDMAEAEEARNLQTTENFAGLGSTSDGAAQRDSFMDILNTSGETMGVKLLKKMGWREGQGVGPKVRRGARFEGDQLVDDQAAQQTHLFAPENSSMISFIKKNDRKGLGFAGEDTLAVKQPSRDLLKPQATEDQDEDEDAGFRIPTQGNKVKKKSANRQGGFGVGILNDNGSDEEDPYAMGPQISYNRMIGGDKKKKKKKLETGKSSANPLLNTKPVFISRKSGAKKGGTNLGRCHDGRLPLRGFVLSSNMDPLSSILSQDGKYPPPTVPQDWKSSKSPSQITTPSAGRQAYQSSKTIAAASKLSPKSRAALLGETPLPGKSVFDYLTPGARTRIASATNNDNLPPALNEASAHLSSHPKTLLSLVPPLARETAQAALGRGTAGWMPYAEDLGKRDRYRKFLEIRAGVRPEGTLPERHPGTSNDDWVNELNEFVRAAQVFRPMTGAMATRFTSSNTKLEGTTGSTGDLPLLKTPVGKSKTQAEEAAAVGMYGPLTRSSENFYPTRLLCKRFNIEPPAHVKGDRKDDGQSRDAATTGQVYSAALPTKYLELVGKKEMDDLRLNRSGMSGSVQGFRIEGPDKAGYNEVPKQSRDENVVVDPERNEALEKDRPGEAVFKAIFGSDSEDDLNEKKPEVAALITDGSSVSDKVSFRASLSLCDGEPPYSESTDEQITAAPPAFSGTLFSAPPPFSSLYFSAATSSERLEASVTEPPPPAFTPVSPVAATTSVEAETKAALPADNKGESSKSAEDEEAPPPYTEGSSPLDSFTYVMAAAGGAASIITQVQQGGPAPVNTLADVGADEHITLDLRGTRFTLSRDELLTLPEFVLLSLFPNGLLPDGHMNSFHEGDIYPVDYDPQSLQYMLEFFRTVAQTIPSGSPSPTSETPAPSTDPSTNSARDMLQDRAGIIVLREDLDFYAIPPKAEIDQTEMIEVKRAAGRALLKQDGIFSGLRRSEETGTTEQHLIEMLTAGGFNNDDRWGHRAGEPQKAVICSLALARLRTDIKGSEGVANTNAVGMAQKLLLFWRKPARRCWWEGVELDNVEGVEGTLKVWIRRVWTLEMSVIGLR